MDEKEIEARILFSKAKNFLLKENPPNKEKAFETFIVTDNSRKIETKIYLVKRNRQFNKNIVLCSKSSYQ